jgi:hypothetical protein
MCSVWSNIDVIDNVNHELNDVAPIFRAIGWLRIFDASRAVDHKYNVKFAFCKLQKSVLKFQMKFLQAYMV